MQESEKVKVKSLSRVRLFATPWTAAYQAPPSMGVSRQEYWSGVPLPSPFLSIISLSFFFSLSFSLSPLPSFPFLLFLFSCDNKERQMLFSIGHFESYYLGMLSNVFIPSTFSSVNKMLNIASVKYNASLRKL